MRSLDWPSGNMVYAVIKIFYVLILSSLFLKLLGANSSSFIRIGFENELLVEIAEREGKAPWVRGTSEINATPAQIIKILSDFSSYGELFSECFASARVLEQGPNTARLHIVWRYPIFFRNRDSVAVYQSKKTNDGSYRIDWRGDSKPGDPSNGIRLNEVEGSIEIVPLGPNQSRLIYRYIGDLGGDFSITVKRAAWKRHTTHYFEAIKNELKKQNSVTP